MKIDLTHVSVMKIVKPCVFQTRFVPDEILKPADRGLHDIELAVVTLISHELNDYCLRIDDVCDLFGGKPNVMRREVRELISLAHDFYPGKFDPPAIIAPDKMIYGITAIVIAEASRLNDDIDQYVVRTKMDSLFDIAAIDNVYDFACYRSLMEYFEYCLSFGKSSICDFIKRCGGTLVTKHRMMTFLKKNIWYNNQLEFQSRFGEEYLPEATLSDITNVAYKKFVELKRVTEENNF